MGDDEGYSGHDTEQKKKDHMTMVGLIVGFIIILAYFLL